MTVKIRETITKAIKRFLNEPKLPNNLMFSEKSGACLHNNKRKGTLNCGWRGKAARKNANHTTNPSPELKKTYNPFTDDEQNSWGIGSENTVVKNENTENKPISSVSSNTTQNDLNEFTEQLKEGWSIGEEGDDLDFGNERKWKKHNATEDIIGHQSDHF